MSQGNQFDQQGTGFGQFGQGSTQPPQKKGMSTTMIVLIVVGGVGGVTLLCCVGVCGSLVYVGVGQIGRIAKSEFGNHPDVQQQIGEIESTSVNFMETASFQGRVGEDNVFVLDVEGSNGSGQFILRYDSDAKRILWAKMITDQGETTLKGSPPL